VGKDKGLHKSRLKWLARAKHSKLSQRFINYGSSMYLCFFAIDAIVWVRPEAFTKRRLKWLARAKHSSLSQRLINYGNKKCYNIWLLCTNVFCDRVGKARSLHKVTLWPYSPCKHWDRLKWLSMGKCTSLSQSFINYSNKKFFLAPIQLCFLQSMQMMRSSG
jgi:hypothetical protein